MYSIGKIIMNFFIFLFCFRQW